VNEIPHLIAVAGDAGAAAFGAIGLALLLALGFLVVYVLARRAGRETAQSEVKAAFAELHATVDELAHELDQARATSEEPRPVEGLDEIALSLDLDEVLARAIGAAAGLSGVDAAMVSVDAPDEAPIVAAVGISVDAAERQRFAQPPDSEADAVVVSYRPDVEVGRMRESLAVPLANGGKSIGWLAVYSASRHPAVDDLTAALTEVARRAAPAIENALRFREARRLADLDALTGLHNRRYFHETLEREVARARRYRRQLSLIVLDVDDFKAVNREIGHLAGDRVLAESAERLRSVMRQADVPCRVGGDEFAIVLPESGLADADQLFRRVQAAVSTPPLTPVRPFSFSAGIAALDEDDDSTSLFERADGALYRAKAEGKARALPALGPGEPESIDSTVF
jgi:diguanylate cyclase (GGDEF)-like protein